MKPFDFYAPTTVDEALALLDQYKDSVAPIAGGTDLTLELNERKASPAVIVDLKKLKELDYKQTEMLMHVPNIAPQAPEGKDSSDNVVEKDGPIPFDFYAKNRDFQAVDHKTLGERLGIFDFERGAKISGNGFPVYRGLGSRLERALIQWFLDGHMANGF